MATTLSVGDIAIVQYNTSTDTFSFVFLRDVEAGTVVNFTDNGWLAAGGFRPGENTVTYTAPSVITAGAIVTLSGLALDVDGDQIIAYQGDPATPTILYVADFADGNNTVAGDATNDNTTALPPGFTLGVNAVAVAFDTSLYAGPTSGSPDGLFAALTNSANRLEGDSLPAPLIVNAKPIIDLDADDSTHLGDDYEGSVVAGGPAVPIADTDVAIDDLDDFDIFGAEIRIIGLDAQDLLAVNGSLPPGIVVIPFRTPDGVLRLEGQASHADYEQAIRQVVFSTTDTLDDSKRINVSLFDGHSWSKNSTAFIAVTLGPTVAPPGLDLDANDSTGGGADATATYTAGGPAMSVTDIDVSITADIPTIESATITILGFSLNEGDMLSVAGTLPVGITASSYNPFTGIITLSGPASLADYQTALRQVVYSSTLAAPSTADRTIQVTVNDGALESNVATMFMHIAIPPPNLAPVLNLDADSSTTPGTNYLTMFTEGALPVAIVDIDVLAFDSDSPNLASATITLTNPQAGDHLTFDGTPPAGILASGSGTNVIRLTGVAFNDSYELALRQIRYSNNSVDPSNVTRTIEVVVSDGTSDSNTATAIVQVEAVNNSAPVIDLDPNDSSASVRTTFRTIFTENGLPIPIADTDTSITDLDSPTLVFATITLANRQAGDLLIVALPLPGGISASAYNPGTGVLTLTGTATLDDYEVALQRVLYGSTSEDPGTDDRLIEVLVNDGVNTSNVAAALINVLAANDAPDILLETSAAYVENAAVTPLAPLATFTDVDNAEFSEAVVRITDGTIPGDGDILSVDGLTSGTTNGITFLWDAAEHALVFTGASLAENYQNLLRIVGFNSTSDNPTDFGARATRVLTWSVSDGTAVTTTTTTIDILDVNDAPQAAVAATASYTENGAPVVLSPASIATDVDNITLVSGEVRIVSGAVAGDLLTVNGLQSGTFAGIDFFYDFDQHILRFTHPAPVTDYEAFLQAIAFSSTSDDPTNSGANATRTLAWFVSDFDAFSAIQTTVVSITAAPDPPVNTMPGAQVVNEEATLPIAGVSVADVDSTALTTTLSVVHGALTATGTGVSGSGTATLTIAGTAAEINAALGALSYRGNLNFNGADTLTVTTSDGALNDTDTVAITVNAVNDPPVNTVPGPLSVNEDTTLPIAGVSVTDVDSTALTATLSVVNGTLNVATGGGATIGGNGTGTVTISGTATQINSALAGLGYRGNLNFNGADTLTVTTSDGSLSDTDTVAITVNAVSDPPVNTVPGAQSVAEDTTLAIAGVSVTDVDSTALTATLTVVNGTLNVATGGGATIGGDGSGTVTISGTAAQINSALAALSYRGNLNFTGADTLTVTTTDGALNDIDTVPITVNAANDPPVSTVPGPQTVAEDTTLAIAGVSVADADGTSLTATLTVASGTLNVTTGGGATIGGNGTGSVTVSGTAAQINSALAGLSYRGNLNFNGADTLTVTTSDGSLSDIDTVPITVNALNDPPVNAVPGAQSVAEDTTLALTGVSVADVDSTALMTTLSVTNGTLTVTTGGGAVIAGSGTATVTISGTAPQINNALAGLSYLGNLDFNGSDTLTVATSDGLLSDTDVVGIAVGTAGDPPVNTVPLAQSGNEDTALPIAGVSVADVDSTVLTTTLSVAHGVLTATDAGVSGSGTATVTITGSATQINAALAGLSYLGNLNFNGPDTLTVSTSDGALTDTDTVGITVNAVSDAPVNAVPGAQSVNEDTPLLITGVSVADVDSTALTATLTVAHGTLTATGTGISGSGTATLTITGTGTQVSAALGTLSYLGDPNFHGSDTLTVVTSDGSLSDTDTVPITVQAVNDVPVNTVPLAQTVDEDTVLPIAGLSVADVDSSVLLTTLSVVHGTLTATSPVGGARLSGSGTATMSIAGTAAQINAALATLGYLGNPDFNGSDTLTVTTSDGASNDTDTVAITVNAVNDLPVNTVPGPLSVNEDTTLPIGVSVADVDGTTLTTTLTVASGTLNVTTGGGATIGGNGTNSVVINGTAAQINSALAGLSYRGNLDFNGADTLTVATSDGSSSDTDTVAITVNPVDDAPVNTVPGAQIANEDTSLPIAGLSVTDTDSLSLVTTLTVAHGTLTATGTGISGSGTATLTITGTGTQVSAALGTLSYLGSLNFNGADTLTVTTSDGSSSDTDTVPITVNAVNDPPVNTVPGARSVNEDTPLPIGGVSVADVDSPSLVTTLTVAHGTLSATGAGVAGSGTATLTISGSATQINTALGTLSYHGNPDFNGPDTLTVSTSDGAITDTDAVAITVQAVNDPPVNTVPGAQTVNEDSTLAIGGVSVADVEGATLTTILSVTSGKLTVGAGGTVSNNGTGTVTISGTAAQINASLATLSYRGNLNFNGADTLTVATSDGTLTDADAVAITVNAVNDRPVLDLDADNSSGAAGLDYTATFIEGGTAVAIADGDALITDVDNANLASATITLANRQPDDLLSVGTLPAGITASTYDPATGVLTLTGAATLAAYQAALRQIAFSNSSPAPSAADRIINIVVNDGAAGSPAAHAFVHVAPLDTAPALDLDANNSSGAVGADYTAVFTGGGAAVPIADADTLIADADSSNIVAATIALTNAQAHDFLAANGDLPTGIAGAFDPATGIFTLTGSAPLADYQAALRQIEFGSTDPNPLTATRIIEVTVNDGSGNSNAALSLIQIAVSAPPTLDLDADDSTASGSDYATIFTEGGPPVPLADTDIVFSAPPIVSATITLTNPFPGDLLTVIGELPEGITFTYDPVTFVLTLNGPGTAADFESVSDQVVYTNSDPNPSTDPRIITVVANDGTSDSNIATAIVHFAGTNDPPSLSVAPAASYTENAAAVVVSPDVTISDPDDPTLTIGIAAITEGLTPGDVLTVGGLRSGLVGLLAFDWAPTLNELVVTGSGTAADYEALFQSVRFHSDSDDPTNGGADTTRTVSWAVFDGATTTIATTTLTLTGVNDAPVNNIPAIQEVEANTATAIAGLSVSDPDAGAGTLTTTLSVTNGMLTVSAGGAAVAGSGTGTVTLTGTLAQINTTLGSVIYLGARDFFGTDTLTMTTSDGGSSGMGGSLTDAGQMTIHLNTHLLGTPNEDSFTALPGNERIDAFASTDTITFGFRLVDATVSYVGNMTIIDGPGGSHTVLTGFETFVFTDGIVFNSDENWLVDDLFYYSQYHDVWNAHEDADLHYDIFGWHEARDPSFFYSTTMYLSANPDVAAAGVNPLDHWHDFGWVEGRVPSLNFGPQQYLAAYPDVAAAHVDPLHHFLEFGHDELREPFPPSQFAAANGFDYVYYLEHNPDVAASGVDPFAHYMTVGWTEGRNPNAWFDTNGYLANYPDVAAANINPLEHYHQFGWHEGRDPSVGFDTTAYLAAYPDVAASGVNPLTHFLQYGILEARSPFADGVWG